MLHKRSGNAVRGSRDGDRSRRRLLCGRLPLTSLALVNAILVSCAARECLADQPTDLAAVQSADYGPLDMSDGQALRSVQWLADLTLRKLPRTIDGDKGWGDTKRVWAGVKVRLDGGKLKTNRRWRTPEHGRWVRYKLQLPAVDQANKATAKIHQVDFVEDEATGVRRWLVDSTVIAPMKFEAQIQRWNLGVKLFSVTIQGRLRLRLNSSATIGFDTDYSEIPPALVFDPNIKKAKISLETFEVERVSHIGGDVAEGWGEVVQEVIVETYLDHLNKRLVKKMNRSIAKERDDLRLSVAQWFAWNQSVAD
jgi:hypothetical protein